MSEVSGPIHGDYDYLHLKGDTGPLVYPAGFVYFYEILYFITKGGSNIVLAQYLFLCFYLIFLSLVLNLYSYMKYIPPWIVLLLCLSKRVKSLFYLRLFNDDIAMLVFYLSLNYLIQKKYVYGCIFFSLAVSIKMNVMLYSFPLLIVLLKVYYYYSLFISYSFFFFLSLSLCNYYNYLLK